MNKIRNRPRSRLGLAAASLVTLSSAALAHAAAATHGDGAPRLAEIIVTATKHATTLQTTPMAITAVSGSNLEDRGITDFSQLAATVPSVSMKNNGAGQTEFRV